MKAEGVQEIVFSVDGVTMIVPMSSLEAETMQLVMADVDSEDAFVVLKMDPDYTDETGASGVYAGIVIRSGEGDIDVSAVMEGVMLVSGETELEISANKVYVVNEV